MPSCSALPQADGPPRPWLPALLLDGKLYLFDAWLGLPIPGPEGKGIATLAEVAANDKLLRNLDVDADHRYPVTAEQIEKVVPWIEASPDYLDRRMKLLQSRMSGNNRVVLNVNASAWPSLAGNSQLDACRVWPLGYETLAQRR